MSTTTSPFRRVARAVISVAIGTATFAALAAAGLASSLSAAADISRPAGSAGALPARAPGTHVVAIVLGRSTTDTADVLVPFEVFSTSHAFSVYTVAETAAPAPLEGGLALVPSYTFAQVAAGIAPTPDLVVVPAVSEPDAEEEAGARAFVSTQYRSGARILGVCAGSRLLAAAGVLDGLHATSHWSRISPLAASRPAVRWTRGERYVQDGRVTTTGGVTSGVWGSLKEIADFAGPAEAERVGTLIDYPGWSIDASPSMPAQSFQAGDLSVLGNTAFPWGRPEIDVQLADGVDEIDTAALLEVYTYSQTGTANARSASGMITTRHGLVLVTGAIGAAPTEALVPGNVVSAGGRHGFDAAFGQLSRTDNPVVVRSIAKMLEYPLDRVVLEAAPLPLQWRTAALLVIALMVASCGGVVVFRLQAHSRRG